MNAKVDVEVDVYEVIVQAASALTTPILEARALGQDDKADMLTRKRTALQKCAATLKDLS
jgi:hypothetical protein